MVRGPEGSERQSAPIAAPKSNYAQSSPKIALCLSGGGLRATFFHLGVIELLRDANLLKNVTHICAVSGGSILAAHLGLNWEKYNGSTDEFRGIKEEIIQLADRDIRGRVVRRVILTWLFGFIPRLIGRFRTINLLEQEYARFYKRRYLLDLQGPSGRPELHLLATSFTTGRLYSFSSRGLWFGRPARLLEAGVIPLSRAVACSSAFPALFQPIALTRKMLGAKQDDLPYDPEYLADGGVFDNLGFEKISRLREEGLLAVDHLLLSDAGAEFDWDTKRRPWWIVSRAVRSTDILMNRVTQSTLETISEGVPGIDIAHLPISDVIKALTFALPGDLQKRISKIRTDLDRFSDTEVKLLRRHGYEVAYSRLNNVKQLRNYLETISQGSEERNISWTGEQVYRMSRALDEARHRRFRMIDFRDWISYLLVTYMALIAIAVWYVPFELQRQRLVEAITQPTSPSAKLTADISTSFSSNAGTQTASQISYDSALVTFFNKTPHVIDLSWVDFAGAPQFFISIEPNMSYNQPTFIGHLWIAKTKDGVVLLRYVAKSP
jgi:predicted acylesterase/phospholipase RssA